MSDRFQGICLPGVTVVIDILSISTHSNSPALSNAGVDVIDGAERVSHSLVVRQCTCRAGLEGTVITTRIRIERVNGSKDGVGILSGSAVVGVDVGDDVVAVGSPEALQEAESLRCLRVTVAAALAEHRSEGAALD